MPEHYNDHKSLVIWVAGRRLSITRLGDPARSGTMATATANKARRAIVRE